MFTSSPPYMYGLCACLHHTPVFVYMFTSSPLYMYGLCAYLHLTPVFVYMFTPSPPYMSGLCAYLHLTPVFVYMFTSSPPLCMVCVHVYTSLQCLYTCLHHLPLLWTKTCYMSYKTISLWYLKITQQSNHFLFLIIFLCLV